jgi:hypothetical protein
VCAILACTCVHPTENLQNNNDVQDLDLEDTARKGIVEAFNVALELVVDSTGASVVAAGANPWQGLMDNWEGPLPQGLADMVQRGRWDEDVTGVREEVKTCKRLYEEEINARVLREQVAAWVQGDRDAFEAFLRETVEPEVWCGRGAGGFLDCAL